MGIKHVGIQYIVIVLITKLSYTLEKKERGCKIHHFPLITESLKNIVTKKEEYRECKETESLIESNDTHVWVVPELLPSYNVYYQQQYDFYCCYCNFSLGLNRNISYISYGPCEEFKSTKLIHDEFVRVECFYHDDKIYDNYFLFPPQPWERLLETKELNEGYNVIVMGIENMSRMNFLRTMPRTADKLKKLHSVQFMGYNKVGDNSYPNLFPLLTGKSFDYVRKKSERKFSEKNNYVWEEFKNVGFRTALTADTAAGLLGPYEYDLDTASIDYYLLPFLSEANNLWHTKNYFYHICLGNNYIFKVVLNYIRGLTKLRDQKLFLFSWTESVSHEHLNLPQIMDDSYVELIDDLAARRYLSKSVLMFVSDHGMRWGDITRTNQGRLESMLPLLSITLPSSFRRKYKQATKNIKKNAKRLITPYDIHETLIDLTRLSYLEDEMINKRQRDLDRKSQGISLFLKIPPSRTCESVGINEHWCACYSEGNPIKNQDLRRQLSKVVVEHINGILESYPQCAVLTVNRLLEASMFEDDPVKKTYRIMFKTVPGGAIFDATVNNELGLWTVSGTVSRLNLYRNQSQCVEDDSVKIFCYCMM